MKPRTSRNKLTRHRRWLFTLFILLGAAAIAWWGTYADGRRAEQTQWFVDQILDGTYEHDGDIHWDHRSWPIGLRPRLDALRIGPDFSSCTFLLIEGDITELGDGAATHHAVISLSGKPTLGLRLKHEGGVGQTPAEVNIIGFWNPQEL